MKCSYKSTDSFKKTIDCLKEIVHEAVIQFTAEKMSIAANDEARVCFIDLCLNTNSFESYETDHKVDIGISLNDLSTVLNLGKESVLNLSKTDEGPLKIKFGKSKFDMNLKNVDVLHVDLPDTPDSVYKIEMDSKEFHKIIKNLSSVGDTCEMQISDSIQFDISGEMGNGSISLNDVVILKNEDKQHAAFKYSVKYLLGISKSFTMDEKVTLYLSDNALLCAEYLLKNGYIRFYLAPKMSD